MKYSKFLRIKDVNRKTIVPAFERARIDTIAETIRACGDFSVLYECTKCGTREWKGFSRCKNKFCACCNAVKALSWLAKTYKKFEQFLLDGKYIVMLTLTIRDRANLEEGIQILNKAWRYFTKLDRQCASTFNYKFAGGVKSLEVKTGENSELWHPHLHCLLVKDRFGYDKMFIDNGWAKCVELAGGEVDERITYIESIYARDENGVKVYDKDALMKGIVESVKYITKFDYANEPTERLQELVDALKGVRQIDTFGCCRNIHKDVEEELEENTELNKLVEHACQICGCNEAKLVGMLTDSIAEYNGMLLTDKIHIDEPWTGKMLELAQCANNKRLWPQPTDEDIDKLEDLYYQSSMFDEEEPKAAPKVVKDKRTRASDNIDKLFDIAVGNSPSKGKHE